MKIDIRNDVLKITSLSKDDGKFNPAPQINNKTNWGNYFVWIPKIIKDQSSNKRYWIWLEVIQRREVHWQLPGFCRWSSYFYQYKVIV